MSAYVLNRKHFVNLALFINKYGEGGGDRKIHVFHPDVRALKGDYYLSGVEAANALLMGNLESVAHRYSDTLEQVELVRDNEAWNCAKAPRPVDVFGVLRSLQYQSCERSDYYESLAYAVLIQVLWMAGKTVAAEAGAEEWA